MDTDPKMDLESKKTLSQWEIDLLLGTVASQEGQELVAKPELPRNVRPYDFRRPDKFSKEHLRALQTIHETFARTAASSLSSYLRTSVQIRLSSIEQAVYGEYMQQLANPTVINIVGIEPLPGHIIVEVNFGLAFALIDRLLGGQGQMMQRAREVTDIEFILLQNLMKTTLGSLREAWSNISPVTITLDELVFSPEIVQAALPGDVGVLLLFELRIAEAANTISVFIPYTTLEPIIGKLSAQMWFMGNRKELVTAGDEIRRQIEKVELPVVVNLGTANVSVRELLGLQKGNVIKLETLTKQELQVFVGGKPKFKARPGRVGRTLGVTITHVVRDEAPRNLQMAQPAFAGAEV